jgi:hypothetical protein
MFDRCIPYFVDCQLSSDLVKNLPTCNLLLLTKHAKSFLLHAHLLEKRNMAAQRPFRCFAVAALEDITIFLVSYM